MRARFVVRQFTNSLDENFCSPTPRLEANESVADDDSVERFHHFDR